MRLGHLKRTGSECLGSVNVSLYKFVSVYLFQLLQKLSFYMVQTFF